MNTRKRAEAKIDLSALEHNFNEIKRFTNGGDIISVVKADAYGHGAIPVARLFSELSTTLLAVACLDEALELRRAKISTPILILGATPPRFATVLAENEIIQAVASLDYAKALNNALCGSGRKLRIHIKLDTGMTRFGLYAHPDFTEAAANEAFNITKLENLSAHGIFTHFAESESLDTAFTDLQFSCFKDVVALLSARNISFNFCHCANSAAVVNYKKAHLSCVRPGLILYGQSPLAHSLPDGFSLRPAMTFSTLIGDVRTIRKGDTVSYNRNFTAPSDMKIAVVLCGYADGIHRSISGKGSFVINGKEAPVLGNVCMDLTLVDVSHIPDAKPFDEVIIFGGGDSSVMARLAKAAGTIPYELFTSVSKRVVRTYFPVDA